MFSTSRNVQMLHAVISNILHEETRRKQRLHFITIRWRRAHLVRLMTTVLVALPTWETGFVFKPSAAISYLKKDGVHYFHCNKHKQEKTTSLVFFFSCKLPPSEPLLNSVEMQLWQRRCTNKFVISLCLSPHLLSAACVAAPSKNSTSKNILS